MPDKTFTGDEPIGLLGLSKRSWNALSRMGICTVRELIVRSPKELLNTRGLGRGSLDEIDSALAEVGLKLGTSPGPIAGPKAAYSKLLRRSLTQEELERLKQAPTTSLPGRPGGRVRSLLEHTGARNLFEVAQLDPDHMRRLPNVGAKTVSSLESLMNGWLQQPSGAEDEHAQGASPLLGRTLTSEECLAAAEVRFPEGAGRKSLLALLFAETVAPDEPAADRAAQRGEDLLLAATYARSRPSEFLGHLLEAAHLTPREALVLRLRWGIGVPKAESLREVGTRFGLSGEWARKLETSATDRLKAHSINEQLRQFVHGWCARMRWPASRWGLLTADEFQSSLTELLGEEEDWQTLDSLCQRIAGVTPADLAGQFWPRDQEQGWFARTEELLRIAQAFRAAGALEELGPTFAGWQRRIAAVCAATPSDAEAPAELADTPATLPMQPAAEAGPEPSLPPMEAEAGDEPSAPARPEPELELEAESEPAAKKPPQPAAKPAPTIPAPKPAAKAHKTEPPARSSAPPPAREFVTAFLGDHGGSAPLRQVIEAGVLAGYSEQRIESVCRNLRRRFEFDQGIVRLTSSE